MFFEPGLMFDYCCIITNYTVTVSPYEYAVAQAEAKRGKLFMNVLAPK
jgi:hypothetical protein